MSEKIFLFVLFLALLKPAQAQNFDGAKGYIFEQSYVTRIEPTQAETLINDTTIFSHWRRWDWLQAHQEQLPATVKRQGKTLVFQSDTGLKPALKLTSFIDRRKSGERDSQQFVYLQSLPHYHLIGVIFDHDEPHFLLIARTNLKLYFIDTPKLSN